MAEVEKRHIDQTCYGISNQKNKIVGRILNKVAEEWYGTLLTQGYFSQQIGLRISRRDSKLGIPLPN